MSALGASGYKPADASHLGVATLRWPNNFFEFEFAALSYSQPEQNQYAYMLKGFDSDWVAADMVAAVEARPDASVVPKVNSPQEAAEAVRLAGGLPVWAMIESPRAVLDADRIAGASRAPINKKLFILCIFGVRDGCGPTYRLAIDKG